MSNFDSSSSVVTYLGQLLAQTLSTDIHGTTMGRETTKIIASERRSLEHCRAIWGGRGGRGPGKIY